MVSEGSEKLELPQQVNLTAALLKYSQVVLEGGGGLGEEGSYKLQP